MITVAELFPRYTTASKWLTVFKKDHTWMKLLESPNPEDVRLQKEYMIRYKSLKIEECVVDGILQSIDGPALIYYHDDGRVSCMEWYRWGRIHRTDGPAFIRFSKHYISNRFDNDIVRSEVWYFMGEIYREDKPAGIDYKENGDVSTEDFYKNGKRSHTIHKGITYYTDDY